MTADEVLQQMQNSISLQSDGQIYCIIDPDTRQISIPSEYQLLGVESDEKTERIWFQCPKIVGDNIDLSKLQIRVNYQNANSQKDQYIVTDVQVDGDNIIFSWQLYRKVTRYMGTVSFIVCAVKVSGETIQNEWNTTLATAQVLQGLEVEEPEITEEESDVIAQLLQIMTDTSDQAVSNVNVAKTNAISAITSQQVESVSAVESAQSTAVQAIENKGESIKESLPSDYVELESRVSSTEEGIDYIKSILNKFNLGLQIKSSTDDLNKYINPGIYYWDKSVYPAHGIASATPAGMVVFPYSSNGIVQIMYKDATRIYMRSYNGSAWSEWMHIDTSLVFTAAYLQNRKGDYITTRNGNRIMVRVEN